MSRASSNKILILTEGVLPYLTTDAVAALADDLMAIGGGDVDVSWIVDYFSPQTIRYRKLIALSRQMRAAPLQFEPADWFAFFAQHGWKRGRDALPRRRGGPAAAADAVAIHRAD